MSPPSERRPPRRLAWRRPAAASSQVVQQRQGPLGECGDRGDHGGDERPVEERDADRPLVEPPPHVRPEVAFELDVGPKLLQSVFIHSSFFLRMRTARKTRDLTPLTEMPRPRAISS